MNVAKEERVLSGNERPHQRVPTQPSHSFSERVDLAENKKSVSDWSETSNNQAMLSKSAFSKRQLNNGLLIVGILNLDTRL